MHHRTPPTALKRASTLAALALALVPATAAAKPKLTLAFAPQGADAGQPIAYTATASGVPSKTKLVVQRQMGTAKKYATVATLPRVPSGSLTLPALSLGSYRLRIAVLRRGKTLASKSARLRVFGDVKFSTLFNQSERTLSTPSRSFSYVIEDSSIFDETGTTLTVDASKNFCRSVHVDWVPKNGLNDPSSTATLSVIQESRDPVSDSAQSNEFGAIDAALTPNESWGLTYAVLGDSYMNLYINGTANCYSSTPVA